MGSVGNGYIVSNVSSFSRKNRSPQAQRGYLMTFSRLFCDPSPLARSRVTDHGSLYQRATLPLQMLKQEVAILFNCSYRL